jgi:hypothetical protein
MYIDGERKGSGNKIPAYAVLITILNLSKKWAPGVVCFRLSATRPGEKRTCSPQTRIGPKFKLLAQKQMTITHIAGVKIF